MCKILTGVRKTDIKLISHKKRKNLNERIQVAYKNGFIQIKARKGNSLTQKRSLKDDDCSISMKNKRERSRVAAKTRRNNENDTLADLYLSLPVSRQSKLLSQKDTYFIGFFEKTTIIKVAGYVVMLYNSLTDSKRLPMFGLENEEPTVSLFSQSLIGIFYYEDTKKVVFTTPGLARLTGLYWCNVIGMPINSILVDSPNEFDFNTPNSMMFLRFMVNTLKERGIFSVKSSDKPKAITSTEAPQERKATTSQLIGKIPCSVWGSEQLSNGIRFDLIQPLVAKSKSIKDGLIYIDKAVKDLVDLPLNEDDSRPLITVGKPFSLYFEVESFKILAVDEEVLLVLGFTKKEVEGSNLFQFLHLSDVIQLSEHLHEMMENKSRIRRGIFRLCTTKKGIFQQCQYTLQINGDQEVNIPNIFNSRSASTQGEAFSLSVIDAFKAMDQEFQKDPASNFGILNAYLQMRCMMMSFYYESDSEDDSEDDDDEDEDEEENNDNKVKQYANIDTVIDECQDVAKPQPDYAPYYPSSSTQQHSIIYNLLRETPGLSIYTPSTSDQPSLRNSLGVPLASAATAGCPPALPLRHSPEFCSSQNNRYQTGFEGYEKSSGNKFLRLSSSQEMDRRLFNRGLFGSNQPGSLYNCEQLPAHNMPNQGHYLILNCPDRSANIGRNVTMADQGFPSVYVDNLQVPRDVQLPSLFRTNYGGEPNQPLAMFNLGYGGSYNAPIFSAPMHSQAMYNGPMQHAPVHNPQMYADNSSSFLDEASSSSNHGRQYQYSLYGSNHPINRPRNNEMHNFSTLPPVNESGKSNDGQNNKRASNQKTPRTSILLQELLKK